MLFSLAILLILNTYLFPRLENRVEKIGLTGTYTIHSLPEEIVNEISFGLTSVNDKEEIKPGAAYKWEIKNNGKTYIFHIKNDLFFHNSKKLTSDNLNINFKDAKREKIDEYTVKFDLKSPYSPFLASVSKPIFEKNYSGLGKYKISKIDLNAGYLRSLSITNVNDKRQKKIYYFYPTEEALKVAFSLGEVNKIEGTSDFILKDSSMSKWKNVKISRKPDYGKLMVLFYNNSDKNLSDKKLRQALNYALPNNFIDGERALSCINPNSHYYSVADSYTTFDLDIAKSLLDSSEVDKKDLKITISVLEDYKNIAEKIKDSWAKIGIETEINVVNEIPIKYEILLYLLKLPKDPDQYTLWHSDQKNNISNYNNKRIDKLLEDGRKTHNLNERITIYREFQKYLLADSPASFLYFPYKYKAERFFSW